MTEAKIKVRTEVLPVVLRLYPALDMDEEQFFEFCQQNRDLRIERTKEKELEIMPPTGGEAGNRNFLLNHLFAEWVLRDGTGAGFDSSTGFILPNGATRSPDVAWTRRERLAQLTSEQKRGFLPLCPDFVIELRSTTDRLSTLQAKMWEYIANGARLGWLIDPEDKRVHVYRPEKDVESVDGASEISGAPELPGFVLDLKRIWEASF